MSMFSSPASVPVKKDEEVEDPSVVAQRKAIAEANDATRAETADKARRRYQGRTMGTEGANALFTGTAAGYGTTMGSANI